MVSNVASHLQRGFVEANADDGLLEIFGLKHGWHASFVMVELISAKHIAQVSNPVFSVIEIATSDCLIFHGKLVAKALCTTLFGLYLLRFWCSHAY